MKGMIQPGQTTSAICHFLLCLIVWIILPSSLMAFSEEEPETIVVGLDENYPPYEFLEDDEPKGYTIDVIREVARVMGFKLKFQAGPFGDVRQALKEGRINMLSGMYYSEARSKHFAFTTRHLLNSHAIFHRKDRHIHTLEELWGKTVLVQRGDLMHDFLLENKLAGKIVPVKDQLEALKRLNSDSRYDAALLAKLQGVYFVEKFGLSNIDVTSKAIQPQEYCFAVQKNNRLLLATLNEGLAILRTNGTIKALREKWFKGEHEENTLTLKEILLLAAWILIPLALLLLLGTGWVSSLRWQVHQKTRQLQEELEARTQAELALQESHARQKAFVELAPYAIFLVNPQGKVLAANSQAEELYGYSSTEWNSVSLFALIPDGLASSLEDLIQHHETPPSSIERINVRKDGSTFPGLVFSRYATKSNKVQLIVYVRDISNRKKAEQEKAKLEAQLRQSQRLESIGRLAGGVAHDFNNLLTSLSGNVELARMDLPKDHQVLENLDEIQTVADRATKLTSQLLAFSRRQIIEPKVIDLNASLMDLHSILKRLIGEDIQLHTLPTKGLWHCKVDPVQMEQVVINLIVNARDAMPSGGRLIIETANVKLDPSYCELHHEMTPGDYVMVAVSDNGMGMDEATRSRIFEPFYTTKEAGKGTGLGLSTAYGIVKQHHGGIEAYSELNEGTTFKVYLPRVIDKLSSLDEDTIPEDWPGGSEHLLVVEDDAILRNLTGTILGRLGYQVTLAANGDEALRKVSQATEPFALAMTDVVMPGLNGKEVAEQIKRLQPDTHILFASGYTENIIVHHGVLEEGVHFIGKPYAPMQLAKKLRDILDGPKES